jgi:hypothetical protein
MATNECSVCNGEADHGDTCRACRIGERGAWLVGLVFLAASLIEWLQ